MTKEEKQKAIDALKISAPVRAMTQEEFNDYIQTINQIMDWLEQESCNDVLDKIRAEIEALPKAYPFVNHFDTYIKEDDVRKIIDKYKAESELEVKPVIEEVNKMNDFKDCKQEAKNEPPSAISKDDLSKSFMLGLTFGFGETHDGMDSIKKLIEETFKPVQEIRAEIASHCSLIKEDHCKFCSSCHCLMGVREILDILNKHGGMKE